MGEESRQLKEHIAETRDELSRNIDDLETKVKNTFDWRAQFEERPMTMIGLAVGAGVLLSTMTAPRSRSAWPGPAASLGSGYGPGPAPAPRGEPSPNAQRLGETWERIKGALVGVAAVKVQSLLDDFVPGFRNEYQKADAERTSANTPKIARSAVV